MKASERVIKHIRQHLDRNVDMNELADVACLSTVQLYRVFLKETGLTPIQYGERMKVKESLTLLRHEKVNHVAYAFGYQNYETFSRAFKKLCGIPPIGFKHAYEDFESQRTSDLAILIRERAMVDEAYQLYKESDESIEGDVQIFRIMPEDLRSKSAPIVQRDPDAELAFSKMIHHLE